MDFYAAIQLIDYRLKITQREHERRADKKERYISSARARGTKFRMDTAVDLLDAVGYSLVAVPKEQVEDTDIVITRE